MKALRKYILVAMGFIAVPVFAQNLQFSANTNAFLLKVKELTDVNSKVSDRNLVLNRYYPIVALRGKNYIGALIKVSRNLDLKELESAGVKVNSRIGDIWSVKISVDAFGQLKHVSGLECVDVDWRINKRLDNATTESKVKLVHSGTGVKHSCIGDSVVIGIIDGGFDYTHPMFFDTSGTRLRILRVWEQENETGPNPSGFSYGTEIVGEQALLNKQNSGSDNHGSHVAGIAGGSGNLTPQAQYRGVAPGAGLIFVNNGDAASSIADGLNYVFQQATAMGEPAVANMSLGTHIGPHDGTSLMDQAIDNLVGQGKIVVGAAGNEGDTPLHLQYNFTGDTIRTFVAFEDDDPEFNTGKIDHWGSANSDFSMGISITDSSGTVLITTPFYKASENPTVQNVIMIGEDSLNYTVTGVGSSVLNQKPNLLAEISRLNKRYFLTLILTSSNTQLNIWNDGLGNGAGLSDVFNGEKVPGYLAGDVNCTVGEIGGTSNKIITVGAYTTKHNFVNIKGDTMTSADPEHALAFFSSRGPTVDGRTKPEITAPGEKLVSSVNSGDTTYNENNSNTVMMVEQGESKWYFAAMQGTSMATPMTTGIIALMLQANPKLGPERVKQLLEENARTDAFTGVIPPSGSNVWGWGKIDAQKSVQAAFSVEGIDQPDITEISIYPNPSRGQVFLSNNKPSGISANIYVIDLNGNILKEEFHYWNPEESYMLDLSNFADGLYLIKLSGASIKTSVKVQVSR